MKKLVIFLMILTIVFVLTSCNYKKTADQIQAEQTEQLMGEVSAQIGMPNVVNFQQKKLMKMIYEFCDKEDLICYTYLKADYTGKLVFIGKCIGFGIPFSAQYTNPNTLKRFNFSGGWDRYIVPQADPNGLFMPTSSSATWLMMIDPKTERARPVYIEPQIVVSPFQLH